MLTYISGKNRTRRYAESPKVIEQRELYKELARTSLFRAYPSMKNFTAEICVLDAGELLELFWSVIDLGGPAPGGWYQVHDLKVVFERTGDGAIVELPLTDHIAGFDAWYRMRGGMISVLPNSFYFNLDAGEWIVSITGALQDAQPLCLFADAFDDMFHYHGIKKFYAQAKAAMLTDHWIREDDSCPLEPFKIIAGTFSLDTPHTAPIGYRHGNRLHQVAVSYSDVANLPAPPVNVPVATALDPVNYFRSKMQYLQDQSVKYNHCPYGTGNHWASPPDFDLTNYLVDERTAFFHIEALSPFYRATGEPDIYRSARKWYETIARNTWPAPGGGTQIMCGSRTQWGTALYLGAMCDAVCEFAEIDRDPRWVAPLREGMLDWPMHPTIPRPLMDQDAWGNEETITGGTYNMCCHYAVACWRVGYVLGDSSLMEKGEYILNNYIFPAEKDSVWPYRSGNFPAHHYDMLLKWQLARLLLTGAERWTKDTDFLARVRRGLDATISRYAKLENGELVFWDWTHNPKAPHPANASRHGCQQLEVMLAAAIYIDEGYIEPLTQTLRGLYRLLMLPEVDACWHGSWLHVHGNLLAPALHGFHVKGDNPAEMRVVKRERG